jgi:iron complex outermembrane receptor protein
MTMSNSSISGVREKLCFKISLMLTTAALVITPQFTIAADEPELEEVTVTGSRAKPRSNLDSAVPVDVIIVAELNSTGQIDVGQSLHYSAPSFSAVKFGINDLSPLTDPATLRGLSPDQTLLLVNGKRRHKVSFINLNHGLAKGQLGNDINAIPALAIKQVEILRDGAGRSMAPMPSPV